MSIVVIERPREKAQPAQATIFGWRVDLRAVGAVLTAFVATRMIAFFLVFASSVTMPMRPGLLLYASPGNLLLDGLIRNDSWWYYTIVTQGYTMGSVQQQVQGTTAFFPLYPLLIKLTAGLVGNVFLAGVLVTNLAFLVALGYLYALARREMDEQAAARTLFYLAAAPASIFFSAMYTESVFLALTVATFYYARERCWARAALAGALASATRNTGVLLLVVIALEGLHQQGVRFRPPSLRSATLRAHYVRQCRLALASWRSLMAAALVPLGLLGYMAYLSNHFGDPLGFIHVEATWGRDVSGGGITKIIGTTRTQLGLGPGAWAGHLNAIVLLNLLITIGFGALVIAVARTMRPAYAVYAVLSFLIPLSTGSVGSMVRYVLMLVPCYMLLGRWGRSGTVDRIVLGAFLPLMGYMAILYSHWYFPG